MWIKYIIKTLLISISHKINKHQNARISPLYKDTDNELNNAWRIMPKKVNMEITNYCMV
jgi:hypothetical protein